MAEKTAKGVTLQRNFQYWFTAIHLLTSTKKSFSASELQRQLDHKNYMPIWAMLHELRIAMGKRDERYTLTNMVELDEGFFTTEVPDDEKGKPLKKGRGSQRKTKVLVMAETVEGNPTKKSHKHTAVRHIKMIVIDDLEAETIDAKIKENIEPSSTIFSDHSTSYTNFKSIVASHRSQVIPKEKVGEILPWVHIAISNAMRLSWMSTMTSAPATSRTTSARSAGSSTAGRWAKRCSSGLSWRGWGVKTRLGITFSIH